MKLLFRDFLEPLKRGEVTRLVMKLHFREMIEPTGDWQEEVDAEIKPQHEALVALLTRHLGLPGVDVDVHRLAFSIIGMAMHFYVGLDVVTNAVPEMRFNRSRPFRPGWPLRPCRVPRRMSAP